jgi:hypothetical protein
VADFKGRLRMQAAMKGLALPEQQSAA